jgi:hypothetical protein
MLEDEDVIRKLEEEEKLAFENLHMTINKEKNIECKVKENFVKGSDRG